MNPRGTEALAGKASPKPAKAKAEPAKKASHPAAKKSGAEVHEIRVRRLHDKSFHIEHHYRDKNGLPDHQVHEFSATSPDDVAGHMLEHLGGGDVPQDAEAAQGAQEAQPVTSQPQQGAPGEE